MFFISSKLHLFMLGVTSDKKKIVSHSMSEIEYLNLCVQLTKQFIKNCNMRQEATHMHNFIS